MSTKLLLASSAAALLLAAGAAQASVTTDVFSGGLVGTLHTPGISFATDTGYNWHPFGLGSFNSDSHGAFSVGTAGTYTFTLNSDDGSQLFIDGGLVVDDGGAHGPNFASGSVFLTAGLHNFDLPFFECCGGASGVDLYLPNGVSYAGVPEPAAWALMLAGFGLVGATLRRRPVVLEA